MPKFAIRPELNYHKDGDYELLHEALKLKKIYRVIWAQDIDTKKSNWYDLPTGMYVCELDMSISEVETLVIEALRSMHKSNGLHRRDYELIVFKFDGSLSDLELNTDISKRP